MIIGTICMPPGKGSPMGFLPKGDYGIIFALGEHF